MKQKILLLICSLSAAAVYAQPRLSHARGHQGIHVAGSNHATHSNARTTATASRCIASVYSTYNTGTAAFVPNDSTTYAYSGTRPDGRYDNGIVYNYVAGTYNNSYKLTQTLDANNNVIVYAEQQWDNTTSAWVNNYRYTSTFDGANNELTWTAQNWNVTTASWVNSGMGTNTYAAGRLATEMYQSWNTTTSAWDHASNRYTYTYDGMGNRIADLGEYWNTTTSAWENMQNATATYDASNNCIAWISKSWNTTTGTWDNSSQYLYSNYSGTYPQTRIYQTWNATTAAYINNQKTTGTCNSDSQPIYEYAQSWNTSASAWAFTNSDDASRYYYEQYTTAIANVQATGGNATVYPAPATNSISINLVWDEQQACTITLHDVQGRVLRNWDVPPTTSYHATLDVTNLPAGQYYLTMAGAKGKITKTITIAK